MEERRITKEEIAAASENFVIKSFRAKALQELKLHTNNEKIVEIVPVMGSDIFVIECNAIPESKDDPIYSSQFYYGVYQIEEKPFKRTAYKLPE